MHAVRQTRCGVRRLAQKLAVVFQRGDTERYRLVQWLFLSSHAAMQASAPPSKEAVHSLSGIWGGADSLVFDFWGNTASTRGAYGDDTSLGSVRSSRASQPCSTHFLQVTHTLWPAFPFHWTTTSNSDFVNPAGRTIYRQLSPSQSYRRPHVLPLPTDTFTLALPSLFLKRSSVKRRRCPL